MKFPAGILPSAEYSLFFVARYNGATRKRILQGAHTNWYFGFHGLSETKASVFFEMEQSHPIPQSVTLAAPSADAVFDSVVFASYGTPYKTANGFVKSECHVDISIAVKSAIVGKSTAQFFCSALLYGDPCPGAQKRCAIEVLIRYKACGRSTLPLFHDEHGSDWVIGTDRHTSFRSNGVDRSTDAGICAFPGRIAINAGERASESSDFAVQSVLVYSRKLTEAEVLRVEAWLMSLQPAFTPANLQASALIRTPL
jgi:hypothetical protein